MKETKLGSCSLEILKDNVLAPLNRPEEEAVRVKEEERGCGGCW